MWYKHLTDVTMVEMKTTKHDDLISRRSLSYEAPVGVGFTFYEFHDTSTVHRLVP